MGGDVDGNQLGLFTMNHEAPQDWSTERIAIAISIWRTPVPMGDSCNAPKPLVARSDIWPAR